MIDKTLWNKCKAFHGHECGGLTIGYKAATYAIKLLGLQTQDHENEGSCISADEEIVCIAENDACGIDAIQVILGCSVGKGNLLFHMRGKQAFSFYNRKTGESVRLILKQLPDYMSKEECFQFLQKTEPENLFNVKKTKISLPQKARMFQNVICSCCGESVSENMVRLNDGKYFCMDCYETYNRFNI